MADRARRINPETNESTIVFAKNTSINDAHRGICWKCINPGCPVQMTLYNAGTAKAYFASHKGDKDNHIGGKCILSNISYAPHCYDEDMFDKDDYFYNIITGPRQRQVVRNNKNDRRQHTHITPTPLTPIRTIFELYRAKQYHGISGEIMEYLFLSLLPTMTILMNIRQALMEIKSCTASHISLYQKPIIYCLIILVLCLTPQMIIFW